MSYTSSWKIKGNVDNAQWHCCFVKQEQSDTSQQPPIRANVEERECPRWTRYCDNITDRSSKKRLRKDQRHPFVLEWLRHICRASRPLGLSQCAVRKYVYVYTCDTGLLHFQQQQQGRYCWHLSTPQFPTDKKIQELHRPTNHCACPTTPPLKLHLTAFHIPNLLGSL